MQKGGNYFEFFHNTRLVKPTILHFQVRGLSIADLLSFVLFALKDSFLLIRTFVLLGVYTVTCFTHRDMKFLTLHNHSFKLLFSFQSNYKSLLSVSNTMSPFQVNC